jgi:hypothetical protein
MERTIKQSAEQRRTNNTQSERKQSYSERSFRRNAQADEQSRQQRPNADLGSSSSTERKTTNTAGKDRLYSQQNKRISRGPSSSYRRSLHTGQPSWQRQAKKETSVTPTLDKEFSRLNMNNRRLLRGGGEDTYKVEGTYKFLGIPVGSFEGTATKGEPSEEQKPAETAAADTGTADTGTADTGTAES